MNLTTIQPECSSANNIIEIVSIIIFVYEIFAFRSRDDRLSSPLQLIITIISKIIFILTGKHIKIYANKTEQYVKEQYLEHLITYAEKLHNEEIWIKRLKQNESIKNTISKKRTISRNYTNIREIFTDDKNELNTTNFINIEDSKNNVS